VFNDRGEPCVASRRAWFAVVVLLSASGYLVTSRTIDGDAGGRDRSARRRACAPRLSWGGPGGGRRSGTPWPTSPARPAAFRQLRTARLGASASSTPVGAEIADSEPRRTSASWEHPSPARQGPDVEPHHRDSLPVATSQPKQPDLRRHGRVRLAALAAAVGSGASLAAVTASDVVRSAAVPVSTLLQASTSGTDRRQGGPGGVRCPGLLTVDVGPTPNAWHHVKGRRRG